MRKAAPWDGVTANSVHSWTATLPVAALEARYPAVGKLQRLLDLWLPQKADYRNRGINPVAAPSYGVPGNE